MELKELKELKEQMKEYDFFKEGKEDFYDGRVVESHLVYGEHWTKQPMVTVIITTYKRPKLLKQALESALIQENFTDYQVMVVDNEAAPLEQETETSLLMEDYRTNDRVLYYRNRIESFYKMDTAVNYARSKWICILHDDDLLVKNHLATMTGIVNTHPEISFLGCPIKLFYDEVSEHEFQDLIQCATGKYRILHYASKYSCTTYVPGWVGALIEREKYIAIGGMPKVNTGVGDNLMQGKFMHKWGTYQCVSSNGLYCYRTWRGQATASSVDVWNKGYMAEYYWYKYLDKHYHPFLYKLWDRYNAYIIINRCAEKKEGYYGMELNMKQLKELCEWDEDIFKRGIRRIWSLGSICFYIKITDFFTKLVAIRGKM